MSITFPSNNSAHPWIPLLTMASAGVAMVSLVALTTMQSDAVSRRVLTPDRLQDKRHSEYAYRWTQALEKARLQFLLFFANRTTDSQLAQDEELINTIFVKDDKAELEALAQQLLNESKKKGDDTTRQTIRIGRMGTDPKLQDSATACNELFLWLYQGGSTIYQIPLLSFAPVLAEVMDRHITSATFCFVSDASAGYGSQLVVDLVQAATKSTETVYSVQEPLWMVYLAVLANTNQVAISKSTVEKLLFGLCRLQALQARSRSQSTILVTLPGQSTISILLPLLQKVFPDDRHVFCYYGCVKTVEQATRQRDVHPRARIPQSMDEALRYTDPTSYTTPLDFTTLHQSANVMKESLLSALSKLPIRHSDVCESWMGAVNVFLSLKDQEKINGYLPYVLRLDYLLLPEVKETDRHWSLLSLLQFVTGSRSRQIPSQQVDAAKSRLQDIMQQQKPSPCSDSERKAIQNAVFAHKLILIENKTLLDTVQPAEHWTLKAALKAGCSCCAPEEEEEGEEDMGALTGKLDAWNRPKTTSMPANGGFVDGKTTFAFDPTRFANM